MNGLQVHDSLDHEKWFPITDVKIPADAPTAPNTVKESKKKQICQNTPMGLYGRTSGKAENKTRTHDLSSLSRSYQIVAFLLSTNNVKCGWDRGWTSPPLFPNQTSLYAVVLLFFRISVFIYNLRCFVGANTGSLPPASSCLRWNWDKIGWCVIRWSLSNKESIKRNVELSFPANTYINCHYKTLYGNYFDKTFHGLHLSLTTKLKCN